MDHVADLDDDKVWQYCIEEYENANPVVKYLLNNFFSEIQNYTDSWSSDDRVLELGCGAARSSLKIKSFLKTPYFEASENDIRYVRRLEKESLPFSVRQESVYDLQRSDKSIDRIIMLEVLEHLENPEIALQEIQRVCKRSFIVSVPNEPLWRILNFCRGKYIKDFGNTPGHINHWSTTTFRKMLNQFGRIGKIAKPTPWIMVEVIL